MFLAHVLKRIKQQHKNTKLMKRIKLLFVLLFITTMFSSCVIVDDDDINIPTISLYDVLTDYEIWYVDIEQSRGGEVPFLQKAFTVSFRNDTFFANNNLVGMGSNGNGFGLDVGFFDANIDLLEIDHDIDGRYVFEVTQLRNNQIELYHRGTNATYVLVGFQRNTFDYDQVFYDNIHYFLQEYEIWEKSYTSVAGQINPFDEENFIQFLPFGLGDNFRTSKDEVGTNLGNILFDYSGHYQVNHLAGVNTVKKLTLDYDDLSNETFDLTVINDTKIRLYHNTSGTTYEFTGLGLIRIKSADGKTQKQNEKKRIKIEDFLKLKI